MRTVQDTELVVRLRGLALEALEAENLRRVEEGRASMPSEDRARYARSVMTRELGRVRAEDLAAGVALPAEEVDRAILRQVHDSIFGLGAMQPLINDPDLIEININGHDRVWLRHMDGRKVPGPPVAASDEALVEWVRTVATYGGSSSKPWDPTNWSIQMRLPDGSRLVGVMEATAAPTISIRLKRQPLVTLQELLELGDFGPAMLEFLVALVRARVNIIVSGPTGSGKTTMVRALLRAAPPAERLITVEHFRELGLEEDQVAHPDVVAMEERLANAEGEGGISLADLVVISRRLNPDRLIVGELMGPEAIAYLDGATQGNDGGITTLHGREARLVPERIAQYGLRAGLSLQAGLMLTSQAVDVVVHLQTRNNLDGTVTWWLEEIVEIAGFDGEQVITNRVWETPPGQVRAVPAAGLSAGLQARLEAVGWDARGHLPPDDADGRVW